MLTNNSTKSLRGVIILQGEVGCHSKHSFCKPNPRSIDSISNLPIHRILPAYISGQCRMRSQGMQFAEIGLLQHLEGLGVLLVIQTIRPVYKIGFVFEATPIQTELESGRPLIDQRLHSEHPKHVWSLCLLHAVNSGFDAF